MFFQKNDISAELLGVFKIKRENFNNTSFGGRAYDSLSIRLSGSAKFKTEKEVFNVKKGDVLYIPKGADYKQNTGEETVIAIHFINYSHEKDNKIECLTIEDTAYAIELFSQMYDVWKEKKQGYQYLCMSLFYELLHFLYCQQAVQFSESITHENEMNIAMDYIHTNYRKTLSRRNSEIQISKDIFLRTRITESHMIKYDFQCILLCICHNICN